MREQLPCERGIPVRARCCVRYLHDGLEHKGKQRQKPKLLLLPHTAVLFCCYPESSNTNKNSASKDVTTTHNKHTSLVLLYTEAYTGLRIRSKYDCCTLVHAALRDNEELRDLCSLLGFWPNQRNNSSTTT